MSSIDLEPLTQQYGRDLFARVEAEQPIVFTPRWWDDRMMELSSGSEPIKHQLFRLVDVLPQLSSSRQVTQHVREYFHSVRSQLPPLARAGLYLLPEDGFLGGLVAATARRGAERMARRFIAGANVREALQSINRLRKHRLAFTIDLLGEAVLTESEADHYQRHYLNLLDGLTAEVNGWPSIELIDQSPGGTLPRVNVSLKLSSLYSQFDPIDPDGTADAVKERLRPILRRARRRQAFVNVDMEQFSYKDLTIRIFQETLSEPEFRDWEDVGIAIQAYLRSCQDDLQGLYRWAVERGTPVWVRLVKGAYWDYETIIAAQNDWPVPVFSEKWQSDASFERMTRFLMERHRVLRPAIGSHNIRSLAHALAVAEYLQLPPRSFEFQLLYGMADEIKRALVSLDQRVRVYTPYGELLPGMAYLVRRLLENTANESFLKASFVEHVAEEQLLMKPEKAPAISLPEPASKDGDWSAQPNGQQGAPHFRNEPLADFSQEAQRSAMRAALEDVRQQLGQTYPLVIGGERLKTAATIDSINPSHRRQLVGKACCASEEEAKLAVRAAREAFPHWRDTSPEERAACFFRAADILRSRRHELAAWEVFECAKQWREADADVAETIDYCAFYAQEMLRLARPQRRDVPGEDNEYFYEPRGVAIVIAPWNFPMAILCGMTAAAVVTGNTAIMKPAEQSPIIAAKLMEIFEEAGVPPGVVNYVPGKGEEIGPVLVQHPDIDIIAFTGSRPVGLLLNRQGAETPPSQDHVKRVIAEMGGKNAVIVDEDADLDEAVDGVVQSAFGYQGQKCSACSRVIVLQPHYDAFLARLIEATKSLKIGPAEDPGAFVGPVIDDEARQRLLWHIEKARHECKLAHAAELGALADEGWYVAPHIFADVDPQNALAQEELFGPVLAVLKARDLTHALEIANGTPYALTGGLFSRSPANIARVRREFRVGNLYINRKITGALVDRQPFGGFKLSGIGSKAGGPDYLIQFVVPRCITENTLRHGFAPTRPVSAR